MTRNTKPATGERIVTAYLVDEGIYVSSRSPESAQAPHLRVRLGDGAAR